MITPEGAGIAVSLTSTVVTDEVILTDWVTVQPEEYPKAAVEAPVGSALARMVGAETLPTDEIRSPAETVMSPSDEMLPKVPTFPLEEIVNSLLPPTARVVKSPAEPETVVVPVTVFAVRLFIERSTVPVTLVELVIVLGPAGPAGPVAPDNTVS